MEQINITYKYSAEDALDDITELLENLNIEYEIDEVSSDDLIIKYNTENKRIKELEEASMELYNLVHESDLIENKIKANDLYEIIKPQTK